MPPTTIVPRVTFPSAIHGEAVDLYTPYARRGSHRDHCYRLPWPSEAFSLCFGSLNAGQHPFSNLFALELFKRG